MKKRLVGYKVWKCKFCTETRTDKGDLWSHLREVHGIGSIESGSTEMYELLFTSKKG